MNIGGLGVKEIICNVAFPVGFDSSWSLEEHGFGLAAGDKVVIQIPAQIKK